MTLLTILKTVIIIYYSLLAINALLIAFKDVTMKHIDGKDIFWDMIFFLGCLIIIKYVIYL